MKKFHHLQPSFLPQIDLEQSIAHEKVLTISFENVLITIPRPVP